MITLRCTQKLLKRLGEVPPEEDAGLPESRIGGWHGKEVFAGKRRAFIFVNDKTCVSVILPAQKAIFREQFRTRYAGVLFRVGLSAEVIASEMRAAEQIATTRSNSRRSLGVLNEVAFQYEASVEQKPATTDEQIEDWLLRMLIGTGDRDYARPRNLLEKVFAEG